MVLQKYAIISIIVIFAAMNLKAPSYMQKRSFFYGTIPYVIAFSVLFLLVYNPFSQTFWMALGDIQTATLSILFYLVCCITLATFKFVFYLMSTRWEMSYPMYVLWFMLETLSIAGLYLLFATNVIEPVVDLTRSLVFKSFFCSFCILFIPYWIYGLYASNKDKAEEIAAMKALSASREITYQYEELKPEFIDFRDYMGVLKLRLDASSIYYIESQDNYVNIHYLLEDKIEEYLLRCSTSALEDMLKDSKLIRCHRSFIVNPEHISVFENCSGGRARLILDRPKLDVIPVSKTYYPTLQTLCGPEVRQ